MPARSRSALASLPIILAAACGQLPSRVAETQEPIYGGALDKTDDAVMALINQTSATTANACSGTTIAVAGGSGIFLTAGHCVVASDGAGHVTTPIKLADAANLFVVPGPDWQTSAGGGLYYGVGQVAVHPQYDGSVDSPYDIALVRFLGAASGQPVIPVLPAAADDLTAGSAITVVGFGKTLSNAMNSSRYDVGRTLSSITTNQFLYSQADEKGACEGDSGGPALYQTAAGLRVAGITSYGDSGCTMVGASVRISPVVASFIQPFIDAAPKTLSCDDCALAAVGPGNPCIDQSEACATTSSACGQFLSCAGACSTSQCASQCAQSFPQGAQAYDDVVTCQCGQCAACANSQQCVGVDAGASATFGQDAGADAASAPASSDAGAGGASAGTSGCSCDVAARSSSGWSLVLLAAFAVFARRRR